MAQSSHLGPINLYPCGIRKVHEVTQWIIRNLTNKFHKQGDKGIYGTIPGHLGYVTCVRFVRDALLSGDDQGWLHLHQKQDDQVSYLLLLVWSLSDAL